MAQFSSADSLSSPLLHLHSLPNDLLLHIIFYLDLQSISRLSRSSRSLSTLICSDFIWRHISKVLIGHWIHRPELISTQLQLPESSQPPNPPLPFDWTQDPNCFPLSYFIRFPQLSRSSRNDLEPNSWYHFATRFLIPHFHFLGWHVSVNLPRCELILVTYDIVSGRLIAEEVKCWNLHDSSHPLPFRKPFLATNQTNPNNESRSLKLPSWLPLNQIRIKSNGLQYTIAPEITSPHQGFTFDIFTPVYVSSPFFSISPFQPQYTLISQCTLSNQLESHEQLTFPKPESDFHIWEDSMSDNCMLKPYHAAKMIAHRSDIILRDILNQDTEDLINAPGVGEKTLHSFKITGTPAKQTFLLSPPDHHPRIRYQGGPPRRRVNASDIILAGRTYRATSTGALSPVVISPTSCFEYYPINGPSTCKRPSYTNWFEGLWVGTFRDKTHFGKIAIDDPVDPNLFPHTLTFRQLPRDNCIPLGAEVMWQVSFDQTFFSIISLKEAIEFDTDANPVDDGGWILGSGRGSGSLDIQVVDIQAQFITTRTNQENRNTNTFDAVDQIRVKWMDSKAVTIYHKVEFQ